MIGIPPRICMKKANINIVNFLIIYVMLYDRTISVKRAHDVTPCVWIKHLLSHEGDA